MVQPAPKQRVEAVAMAKSTGVTSVPLGCQPTSLGKRVAGSVPLKGDRIFYLRPLTGRIRLAESLLSRQRCPAVVPHEQNLVREKSTEPVLVNFYRGHQRSAMRSPTRPRKSSSLLLNEPASWPSISICPKTLPSFLMSTTISERVCKLHAR